MSLYSSLSLSSPLPTSPPAAYYIPPVPRTTVVSSTLHSHHLHRPLLASSASTVQEPFPLSFSSSPSPPPGHFPRNISGQTGTTPETRARTGRHNRCICLYVHIHIYILGVSLMRVVYSCGYKNFSLGEGG